MCVCVWGGGQFGSRSYNLVVRERGGAKTSKPQNIKKKKKKNVSRRHTSVSKGRSGLKFHCNASCITREDSATCQVATSSLILEMGTRMPENRCIALRGNRQNTRCNDCHRFHDLNTTSKEWNLLEVLSGI